MFDEILACLDGSPLAEQILPLARDIATAARAKLTLLSVVTGTDELSSQEGYLRQQGRYYNAQIKFSFSPDPADAVIAELKTNPRTLPAMTTHGRSAWAEAMLGSVAVKLIRGAGRPVLLYRPSPREASTKITSVVVALDGSEFSEKIISPSCEMARSINAQVMLIQVLPSDVSKRAASAPPVGDIFETSYLHGKAQEIKEQFGIEPQWDVLHGKPGAAIPVYLSDRPGAILAMTSHARGGVKRTMLGSVAGQCIRNAGVPILIYWPQH